MDVFIVKDEIEELLKQNPSLRDDDNRLILNVWALQAPELTEDNCKFEWFARKFSSGNLASTESIRRCRQKLQEEHPELRGKKYAIRHAHQDKVKDDLQGPEFKKGGTP